MSQQIWNSKLSRPSVVASLLVVAMFASVLAQGAGALSLIGSEQMAEQLAAKQPVTLAVIENPELTAHVLDNLLRSIVLSANVDLQSIQNQKRGLDLGISRGFSGSQAGKHLMGLSAASFANGPGRK